MHLIPKFELNTDPNAETLTEKKKRYVDMIERLTWNHIVDFKKEYGIPFGNSILEYKDEHQKRLIRLYCEEPVND